MSNFQFRINIHTETPGLDAAKQELQQLKMLMNHIEQDKLDIKFNDAEIARVRGQMNLLESAIQETGRDTHRFGEIYNRTMRDAQQDTRMTEQDVQKLNRALAETQRDANAAARGLSKLSNSAKLATQNIKSTTEYMDRLKNNMLEGFGQTLAFGTIGAIAASVTSAVQNTLKLDEVITDIAIVSGKAREEMEAYRDAAGIAADNLGNTAKQYLEASLIFEQQGGLAARYANDLAKATLIGTNIDDMGSTADEMSQYITAVMNGFDMLETKGSQSGMYIIDVLSQLGSVSGSSLSEMAEGLQRTANIARLSGYEFEEISSAIAVVSETTRRSASTIGNGFKSLLLSFQQLREGSEEELNAFSNKVEEAFKISGIDNISIFGDMGELRDARDIMEDIGKQWDRMNKEQQSVVSEAIAGKYQAEVFQAFMENQERYHELMEEAYNAEGIAARQQMIYMDSMESKLNQMKNAWQSASTAIVDGDIFKKLIDDATGFLKVIGNAETSLGALGTALLPIAGALTALFGGRIVAQMKQNSTAKDFTASLTKQLEKSGQLTDSLREQLSIGEQQQQVSKQLGSHAGQIYKQNQENVATLKEELEVAQSIKETAAQKATQALESYKENGITPSGVNQQKLTNAENEAREKFYNSDADLAELAKVKDSFKDVQDLLANKFRGRESLLEGIEDDNQKIEVFKGELSAVKEAATEAFGEGSSVIEKMNEIIGEGIETSEDYEEALREINKMLFNEARDAQSAYQDQIQGTTGALQEQIEAARQAELQRQFEEQEGGGRTAEEIQEEINLAEASNQVMERSARRAAMWRKGVELAGSAALGAVPMIASFKAAMDGSITTGEAMKNTMMGLGSSLMTLPHPLAKIVGGLVLGAGMFADFRTQAEKVKETNDELIRTFVTMAETANKNLSAIRGIKEEYTRLHESGATAEEVLARGSEEAKEEYKSFAETVASTSPELVKYYDAEGVAVIDVSKSYKELHAARLEDLRLTNQLLESNQSGFITQYAAEMQTGAKTVADSSYKIVEAQKKLKEQQESGDTSGMKKTLGEIQKLNLTLSEAQSNLVDTRAAVKANIIDPVMAASKVINDLKADGTDMSKEMANSLSSLGADMLSPEVIDGLLSRGQEEQVEKMTNLINEFYDSLSGKSAKEVGPALKEFKALMETDPAKFALAVSNSNGELSKFRNEMSQSVGTTDMLMSTVYGTEEKLNSLGKELEETSKITAGTTSQMESVTLATGGFAGSVAAVGMAAAPFTGGLSLIATGAVVAGAAMLGAGGAAIVFKDSITENLDNMVKNAKEQEKLIKATGEIQEAYAQAALTAKGFNKGMADVRGIRKQKDELGSLLSINPKSSDYAKGFEKLVKETPALGEAIKKSMETGKSAAEATLQVYEDLEHAQGVAISGLMLNNDEYYRSWMDANESAVANLATQYGIDAANYTTLGELKSAMMAASANEFAHYESEKLTALYESNEAQVGNTGSSLLTIGSYYAEGVNDWFSKLDWLGSESLTIGQKIQFALLLIVDGFTGMVAGALETIRSLIYDLISIINGVLMGSLYGLAKTVDAIFKTDFADKVNANIKQQKADLEKQKAEGKFEGTDYAGKFAEAKAAENEARKALAIQDMLEKTDHQTALENFKNGYNTTASDIGINKYNNAVNKGNQPKDKNKTPEKSDKDKKKVEDLKLELDRYYKLNNALAVMDDKMKTLARSKDAAFGDDRINIMNQEQASYAAQTKVLQAYIAELQKEQAEKRKSLSAQGFAFDSNGDIANLNQRLQAMQNAANRLSGEAKEKAIERVKEVQAEANRYTEITFNMLPDKKQALADAKMAIRKLEREKLEYKVKLVVDKASLLTEVRDVMKELNQGEYEKLDDNYVISADQLKDNIKMVKYYQDLINQVQRNQSLTDADRQDMIQSYTSEMLSAASAAKGAYDSLLEIQSEFISMTVDMIEKTDEGFSKIADKASALADAYKEAYGDSQYREVSKLRDIQLRALDAQALGAAKARDEMIRYRDTLKEGTAPWHEANDAVEQLGETIDSVLIEKISLLRAKFNEFMEGLLKAADKEVFGVFGLTGYEEELDRVQKRQDKMLNTFERITKIGEVMADVNKAIAESTDPALAERYKEFKEQELQTLMDADKVSEAQLERAKLLWDIEVKRQAMEQRQNASRMAQLVRDENGNMSYEYVKKENKQDDKSVKELAGANQSLYEFDIQQARDAQKEVLEIIKTTNSKIEDIFNDTSLTEAERKAAIDKIKEQALKDLAEAQEEMVLWSGHAVQDGINSMKDMFQKGNISFAPLGVDEDSVKKVFDGLDSGAFTTGDMLSGSFDEIGQAVGLTAEEAQKVISAILSATGDEITSTTQQLVQTSNDWVNNFSGTLSELQTYYTQTQANINATTNALTASTGNLNAQIDKNSESVSKNTKAIIEQTSYMIAAKDVTDKTSISYQQLTQSLVGRSGGEGTLGAMINIRNEMQKKLQGALAETKRRTDQLSASAGATGATKSLNLMAGAANYSFNMSRQFDSTTMTVANRNINNMSAYAQQASANVEDLGKKAVTSRANIAGLSTALAALPGLNENKRHYYVVTNKDGSITSQSYKDKIKNPGSNSQYVGYFDTGGMYGEWAGSSGNQTPIPAFLHEKELVLNKDDTKNFLDGIMLQRQMLAQFSGTSFKDIVSGFSPSSGGGVEQSVNIYADFPNVSNSNEIEEAFAGMSLRAATHAHKNK